MRRLIPVLLTLFAATAGVPSPRNAGAAVECAKLFHDAGNVKDADFFAELAGREGVG